LLLTLLHHYIDFAVLLHNLDSDWAGVAFHEEADARILDAQIAERELWDASGQVGTI
jgi:hypothetical protein